MVNKAMFNDLPPPAMRNFFAVNPEQILNVAARSLQRYELNKCGLKETMSREDERLIAAIVSCPYSHRFWLHTKVRLRNMGRHAKPEPLC